jgi:hypothetical protein
MLRHTLKNNHLLDVKFPLKMTQAVQLKCREFSAVPIEAHLKKRENTLETKRPTLTPIDRKVSCRDYSAKWMVG